ncbi:hypothetical protein [Leisingera sp. ANG-M7]|uniref:hypothetical protein n=1 Tax=Leisingera sp. ANG-M7 TaxID=1577902 RepID=UPI000A5F72C0|nr:hypothetical protein [Leisingera sp. ANG-M7]
MKTKLILLAAAIASVAACSKDLGKVHERRAALVARVFPAEADRTGISLAFPVESHLEIIYFPDEVSHAAIQSRAAAYCKRIGHPTLKVARPLKDTQTTLADGTVRASKGILYDCD